MGSILRYLLICAAATAVCGAQDYRVIYTGRMMGDFRIPDRQTVNILACGDPANRPNPATQKFLDIVAGWRKDPGATVLVGMGDNFAPDLLARQMQDATGKLQPKEQFDWNYLATPPAWVPSPTALPLNLKHSLAAGLGIVGFDNVGCFLQQAGFDALVPGKHDFYFGPERLRELARYLANPAPGLKAVQMVASNLTVATNPAGSPECPPVPGSPNTGYRSKDGDIQITLPKVVIPSLRRIELANAIDYQFDGTRLSPQDVQRYKTRSTESTAKDQKADYRFGFLCRLQADSFELPRDAANCTPAGAPEVRADLRNSKLFSLDDSQGSPLQAGTSYAFCVALRPSLIPGSGGKSELPICSVFTVHYPFFEYADRSAAPVPTYSNPGRWALAQNGFQAVAVFGVVDTDFKEHIGKFNYSWRNATAAWNTEVEVSDPSESLRQVMQECERDKVCKDARKILLAQMTFARASQLAVNLGKDFDAVIAQTDDGHALGNETVVRTPGREQPFLLVPFLPETPESRDAPESLRVHLQRADIGVNRTSRQRRLTNQEASRPFSTAAAQGTPALHTRIEQSNYPSRLGLVNSHPSARELLEDVALVTMRDYCKADVAVLQHRDVYDPPTSINQPATNPLLQQALDQVFWKGDFIICTRVTGAMLTDLMTQSAKFDAADRDPLNAGDMERNRGLAVLGSMQEEKQWVIAGVPVDSAKLYSIAMPDYLSNGDTGYPALAKPAVAPADPLPKSFHELAADICRGIDHGAACRGPIPGDDYLDPSTLPPYQPTPSQPLAWLNYWEAHNTKIPDYTKGAGEPEGAAENKRQISFTVDKLDIGYSLHLHSHSEQENKNNVAGIPYSSITAAEERDFTGDYAYRLMSSGRTVDWFINGQANYSDKATRTTFSHPDPSDPTGKNKIFDSPFVYNQLTNSMMQDFGVYLRVKPKKKNLAFIRLAATTHLETQLLEPTIQLQLVDPKNPGSPVAPSLPDTLRRIPRTYYLLERFGPRVQTEKSWLEIGFEQGMEFNQPVLYEFVTGGYDLKCDLTGVGASVQSCITKAAGAAAPVYVGSNASMIVKGVNRPRTGAYLNFRLKLPVPGCCNGLGVTLDNQGEVFAHSGSDTVLDTRYYDDLTTTVNVPVWGNFSLAPKVDTYFYRSAAGYYVRAFATSVTLKYHFDWHQGLGFFKAMKYPNPAASQ